MFRKNKIYMTGILLMSLLIFPTSCDLEEEILDEITADIVQSDPNLLENILAAPLAQLRGFWYRERIWGLMEATSDELFFPTRGADWFDGGVWQMNYLHTWTPTHRDVVSTWNHLNSAMAVCNSAIFNLGEPSDEDPAFLYTYRAQAEFLRAFYAYYLYDLYRLFPARDAFDQDFLTPPPVFKGADGFYKLVNEIKTFLPYMKNRNHVVAGEADRYLLSKYGEPDIYAGYMLLAKLYLNKEVYTGLPGYDTCLMYLDKLIDEGKFGLANDYFDMFGATNDTRFRKADDEAILVAVLDDSENYGIDNQTIWVQQTFHYNQTFGGNYQSNWNGCISPEGYLSGTWFAGTDTAIDSRWRDDRFYSNFAVYLGFNYGQQYTLEGDSLFDRSGNPLFFTLECELLNATEYQGVRVLKYPPRLQVTNPSRTANDFIIWRYADALLMKAECLVRDGGSMSEAMIIVNDIRTKRGAPTVSASGIQEVLEKLYIERGLEFYWEGHRRQDMIRFGTFLDPKTNKPDLSPATAIILPIPQSAIDGSEGTIIQNPGY